MWLTSPYWDHPSQGQTTICTDVSETIYGYRGPRIAGSTHVCDHQKVRVVAPSVNVDMGWYKYTGPWPLSATNAGPGACYPTASFDVTISAADEAALMADLCGDIRPIVSVPNMLLELPETLSLWHDLAGPIKELISDRRVIRKWKHGSNALLAQQFGFFPLLSDLKKLMTSHRTVHTELQRIMREQLGTRRRIKKLPNRSVKGGSIALNNVRDLRIKEACGQVSAWLYYSATPTRILNCDDPTVMSAMAQSLYGWDRPAATLWEATPFSFVFDWFFPVGTYLQGLEKSYFADRLQVTKLGWCVRGDLYADVYVNLGTPAGDITVGSVNVRRFKRGGGLPVTQTLDDLTIPGITQTIEGAALILQRLR